MYKNEFKEKKTLVTLFPSGLHGLQYYNVLYNARAISYSLVPQYDFKNIMVQIQGTTHPSPP